MSFEIPNELQYLDTHEWVRVENSTGTIGISDFAQDELGDIVYVELPDIGDTISQGNSFGIVESIKAVSDLYAPVSGEVIEKNTDLQDTPELVNEEPYQGGWMLKVEIADESEFEELLSADEYGNQIE
ncbi:MAG: glycine cleavage system protein GcvH [Halobacteriaceae archaeon]